MASKSRDMIFNNWCGRTKNYVFSWSGKTAQFRVSQHRTCISIILKIRVFAIVWRAAIYLWPTASFFSHSLNLYSLVGIIRYFLGLFFFSRSNDVVYREFQSSRDLRDNLPSLSSPYRGLKKLKMSNKNCKNCSIL